MSVKITSQGLAGTSWGVVFSSGCMFWYPRQVKHYLMTFSMSAFIFTQYNDLHGVIMSS